MSKNKWAPFWEMLSRHDMVVFDVDDTLLYTKRNGYCKICAVAMEMGVVPIAEEIFLQDYGRLPFEECLQKWFSMRDVVEVMERYKKVSKYFPYIPVSNFGIIQEALLRAEKQCAILTNGVHDVKLQHKLRVVGLREEYSCRIYSKDNIPALKPSGKAFNPCIMDSKLPPWKILYVADAIDDLHAAREAGIGFVGVDTSGTCWEDSVLHVPSIAVIKDLLST